MSATRPLKLALLRAVLSGVPPVPRALGLAQHIARPLYTRTTTAPTTAWVQGARLHLEPRQHVDALLLFAPHLVDHAELRFLGSRLRRGSQFIDLGSYLGWYALQLAPIVGPGGRVVCVEAHPDTAEQLTAHLRDNGLPWVEVVCDAIMPTRQPVELVLDDDTNAGSRRAQPGGTRAATTLPALLADCGIPQADAIKTDLEGHDADVVAHTLGSLPRSRWPRSWVCESPRSEDVVSPVLRRSGYRVKRLSRLNIGAWLD